MKGKLLNILLVILLLVMIPGTIALASDVTGALYKMGITVSNNGTLANYVSTVGNISSLNLIAGSYANANIDNVAVQDAGSNDVPFMPGYLTNLWSFFVETIGADTYVNYNLYTADSTGGTIVYFPGATGMRVDDADSLYPGSNFENEIDGWIDTSDSNFGFPYQKRDATSISVTDTDEISGIVYFEEPIELTVGASTAWTDVDVSDYVPGHATGVVLHYICDGVILEVGFRMNGSADDIRADGTYNGWLMVGIDGNDIFEAYFEDHTLSNVYLVGFTGEDVTYKTAMDDISLVPVLAWTDIDLSVEAPDATGVIIAVINNNVAPQESGLRMNASVDNRHPDTNATGIYYAVVGSDAGQIIDGYIESIDVDFYLMGYITGNFTFNTDADDISLAGAAAWTDIDLSALVPAGTTHVIVEVSGVAGDYGLRRNGGAENIYVPTASHNWGIVECDSDHIIEGQIANLNIDFFLIGYTQGYIDSPIDDAVIAASVAAGEHTITHSLNANQYDFSDYDTFTTVAVNMGGGLIPVILLEEQELTAATASVTFSNIDILVAEWDAYGGVTSRHLVLVVNAASSEAVSSKVVRIRFNGDAGANYNYQYLKGVAVADSANRVTATTYSWTVDIPGTNIHADAFGGGTILFPHAFNTTNHKAFLAMGGGAEYSVLTVAGRWADINDIDTILLYPSSGNFATGSTFWLGVVDERYLVEEDLLAAPGTIDFTAISGGGSDLAVIGYGRGTVAAAEDELEIEFNGDGGGATSFTQRLLGTAAVTSAAAANDNLIGWIPADNATANAFGAFVGFINQYAETTNDPHYLTFNGYHETVGPTSRVGVYSGRWNNTVAITQVEFYGNGAVNLATGSLFSLYRVPRTVIDRQELIAPVATITFNNIPQGYEALQILVYAQSDDLGLGDYIFVSYNTDVVLANYDFQYIRGLGGAVTAARTAGSRNLMRIPANGLGANQWGGGVVTIPNYSKADRHKHHYNLSGLVDIQVFLWSSRWEDTSPITRIDLTLASADNFDTGSVFELVGIFPQDVHAIEVDGNLYGISDGNLLTVPDVAELDWQYGLKNALPYADYMRQSGQAPHFTGSATSNINAGVIHNFSPELWISLWFKLDNDFNSNLATNQQLFGKRINGTNYLLVYLSQSTGRITFEKATLGVGDFALLGTAISWEKDVWHHVILSISSTNGARLIIDNVVNDTDVDLSPAPNGADFVIASRFDGATDGFIGVEANIAVGTDDLTVAEELGLYNGTIPADATNIWYADEGTGVAIVDYGTDGDDGVADAAVTWVGSGSMANNNALARGSWVWEYGATFSDSSASGENPATPSFRGASSDADVIATAVSFRPIEEAKAPAWSLSETVATWVAAANITGNFTTTPGPTAPGSDVIIDLSTATGTPAQLPFTLLVGFVTLAISLCTSYLMRQSTAGSLFVKFIVITCCLWIGVTLNVIDFWMMLFFIIPATAILAASKQGDVL